MSSYLANEQNYYENELDFNKAIEYYKQRLENGDKSANFCLAKCYYYGYVVHQCGKNIAKACSCLCDLAKGVFTNGAFTKKDYTNAILYFKKSDPKDSNFYLGWCYYFGLGVRRNYDEAFKYYQQSDHEDSNFYLGECYYNGHGVKQDYEQAFTYYGFKHLLDIHKNIQMTAYYKFEEKMPSVQRDKLYKLLCDKYAEFLFFPGELNKMVISYLL